MCHTASLLAGYCNVEIEYIVQNKWEKFLSLCYGNNHSIIPLLLPPILSSFAFVMKNSVLTSHWYNFTFLSADRWYKKQMRVEVDLKAEKMQCGNRPSSNVTAKVQING